jgi:hypothetical protein
MPPKVAVGLVSGAFLVAFVIADVITAGDLSSQVRDQFGDEPPQAAATPAGDRPIPFQDDEAEAAATSEPANDDEAEDASTEGDPPEAAATAAGDRPDDEAAATAEPSEGAEEEDKCELEVGIGEYVPLYAIGEVTGLGPSARFVVFESCAGPASYEFTYGSAPSAQETAVEGGCLFLNSGLELLLAEILIERGVDVPSPGPLPDVFQARFAMDPVNYLGIAENGAAGVIAGGYSVGVVDQRRGEGQQWGIGGSGRLRYGTEYLSELLGPEGGEHVLIAIVALTAEWSGQSIENWTGEEAFGRVHVTCAVAVGLDPAASPG